jgi:hypothetical protein
MDKAGLHLLLILLLLGEDSLLLLQDLEVVSEYLLELIVVPLKLSDKGHILFLKVLNRIRHRLPQFVYIRCEADHLFVSQALQFFVLFLKMLHLVLQKDNLMRNRVLNLFLWACVVVGCGRRL